MTEHELDYYPEREAEARAGEREGRQAEAQHTPGPWRPSENWAAIERSIASAPDFLAACQGPDPDVSALEWLSALLTDLSGDGCRYVADSADSEAAWSAIDASARLLRELRAAVAKAKGETP